MLKNGLTKKMEQNIFTPKRQELFKEFVNSKHKEFNLNLTLKDIKERENNYTNVAEYWINKKFYTILPYLKEGFSELYLTEIYNILKP